MKHGHLNIPTYDQELGNWITYMRNEYKKFQMEGQKSTLDDDKIKRLNTIGFLWEAKSIFREGFKALKEYNEAWSFEYSKKRSGAWKLDI